MLDNLQEKELPARKCNISKVYVKDFSKDGNYERKEKGELEKV